MAATHRSHTRRAFTVALATCALLPRLAAQAADAQPRLAIKGYDPVSYFTPGKPTPGSADFSYEWDGSKWEFVDDSHRRLFESSPEAYAPQYGGHCAMGVALGRKAEIDPEAWAIVDGKLYLNYDKATRDEWRRNQAANIAQADRNWPTVKGQ
jgi:hypothetical protein